MSESTAEVEMTTPEDFSISTHCGLCNQLLLVPSEDPSESESESAEPEPDDVEIPCHGASEGLNHHFHWDCLIEANESGEWDGQACPFSGCEGGPLNEEGRLIVKVTNDGGTVEDFDLTEVLEDEEEEDLGRRREMFVASHQYSELLD